MFKAIIVKNQLAGVLKGAACEPMTNSSRFSFADVVLVPFPFTDQSAPTQRNAFN